MARVERAACSSAPWSWFAGRLAVPWALDGVHLDGRVLEIGAGAGGAAAAVLDRSPDIQLTVTDVDPEMVAAAQDRLAGYGERVNVTVADATALPEPDATYDAALSFLMLHHVVDWEAAIHELARVVRPGGQLIGYDLLAGWAGRLVHVVDRSPHRLVEARAFGAVARAAGWEPLSTWVAPFGLLLRFRLRRASR